MVKVNFYFQIKAYFRIGIILCQKLILELVVSYVKVISSLEFIQTYFVN